MGQDRTLLLAGEPLEPRGPGGSGPISSAEAHVHLINLAVMVLAGKMGKGGREGQAKAGEVERGAGESHWQLSSFWGSVPVMRAPESGRS